MKLVIIGGRGTAVVIAEQILHAVRKHSYDAELLGYAFDDPTLGSEINGIPVLCKTYEAWERYEKFRDVRFLYQLYRPDLMQDRVKLLESFRIPENRLFTFIHPMSAVAESAILGPGTAVCSFAVVNPNARVGPCCTILTGSLVGHDSDLGAHNFLAAQVAVGSNVKTGIGNFFGLHCTIRNFVQIGAYAVVGAHSNVVKDIGSGEVWYGNPAQRRSGLGGPIR